MSIDQGWPEPPATAGAPRQSRRDRLTIRAIIAVVSLAAGIGIGYALDRPSTPPAAEAVAPAATASPAPSRTQPSVAATPDRGDVGEKRQTGAGTLTVHAYRDPVKLDTEPDGEGNHWAAIDAEACWTKELPPDDQGPITEMTLNWLFWSVADDGNRRYRAFTSGSAPTFLTPSYPDGEPISFGECARGWIMVPVADGAKVATVRYANDQDPAIVWRVTD
jgi:hypothetical protein